MGQHTITYMQRGDGDFTFRCRCGTTPKGGGGFRTAQAARDEGEKHLAYIERIRGLTAGKTETLQGAYAHYLAMAEDVQTPPEDRAQWKALAEETGRRLGIGLPEEVQEELFPL